MDLPQDLQNQFKQSEKLFNINKGENINQITQYISINSIIPKPIVNTITIEKFVAQHFKVYNNKK